MALRPCIDCHTPTNKSRCPRCKQAFNTVPYRVRPSATQRGYDVAWQRLVKRVLARDNEVCWLCGQAGATSGDHVVPLSRGGARLDPANVRAAHVECNSAKGARY